MKITRFFTIVGIAAIAFSGAACSKKKPKGADSSGTTGGVQPDNADINRVQAPQQPPEPTGADLGETDIEGPLKRVYFDFDAYDIRADQRPTMERNAAWLASNSAETVLIEGHCDERGTEEYNLALGDRRANSAKSYLIGLGTRSSRLTTVTYGKSKALDPGHDESAWWKNRRAEFRVGGSAIQ